MGHQHQGGLLFSVQFNQQIENRRAIFRVKIAGRFIGEEDAGLVDQRPADRHPLLLAARKLVGKIALARPQAHTGQHGFSFGARLTVAMQLGREHDIL